MPASWATRHSLPCVLISIFCKSFFTYKNYFTAKKVNYGKYLIMYSYTHSAATLLTGGCYSDPCMNGGICIATNTIDLEQYECRCPLGYTGVNCEMQIDYCAINDPCQNGGWCINALTEPLCECLQGFVGKSDQQSY